MIQKKIQTCEDSHQQISFEGNVCPLCRTQAGFNDVLDDRDDIVEQNIVELFKDVRRLTKQVRRLEKRLLPQNKGSWWTRNYQNVHVKELPPIDAVEALGMPQSEEFEY